ncbi:hypothetical protein [Intrasporangium sp.]|uniref:hypothetical protein n=1 Tax=Intrasporangium sp. TaxID=1925024 RepID=UPI0033655574
MEAGRRQISVGDVLNETFSIYGQNFGALIGGAIVVFVLVGIASGLLQNSGGLVLGTLALIVELVGRAIFVGFVVRLVEDVRDGRRDHTVGDLFSSASDAIVPLIGFGILFGIGVGIGFILLVIPGLFLLTMWSVGAPAIVVEKEGVIGAFGRSWNLVRGDGWRVFAVLLVVFLIGLAVSAVLLAIGNSIGNGASLVAGIVAAVITAPIYAIAVSALFFDLGGGGQGASAQASTATAPPAA